jgi:uncharacterized repeat protein (TIGR02543 family)
MKTSFLRILAAVLLTALCSGNAFADGIIDINSPTNDPGSGWTFSGDILTIETDGTYTITGSGSTTNRIVVASGVTADITLDGVSIDVSATSFACAFDMTGATVNLTLTGTNVLKSGEYKAGLQAPNGAELVIDKATNDAIDKLTATGGYHGAGIGGGYYSTGGNITISGGTVTANGEVAAAGIGGGNRGDGGTITLSGGTVTATVGSQGAGIGGGYYGAGGNIDISGGTVTATVGGQGAGIGGGYYGAGGNIDISGGTVTATGGYQGAGIGGGRSGAGGTITISGGTVTADAGNNGAGIGGGENGAGGNIAISGGTVTANGGSTGAGIGGGNLGEGGSITITGGTVIATGSLYGAGIGGGLDGEGGDIAISGGTVTATGGTDGAGIGGGYGYADGGAGGTITISGGTVTAIGGGGGAGIGGGRDQNNTGTVTITGGSVKMNNHNGPQPTNGAANVYLNTLTLASMPITAVTKGNINFVACNEAPDAADGVYGIKDVKTDAAGKVYFYLPVTATTEPTALIAGRNYSAAFSHSATDHTDEETLTDENYGVALNHAEQSPTPYTFAALGYGAVPTALTVKALNMGENPATFNITLSGINYDSFTLSTPSTGSVNPAEMGEFTLVPKTGLNVGTYTATVTVSIDGQGNSYDKTFDVSFEVEKKDITVSGGTITAKTYDGATAVTVTSVTFDGLENSETLAIGTDYEVADAAFTNANAGAANRTVEMTVALKSTTKANNYNLINGTDYPLTGQSIGKKDIAITGGTVEPKMYDGTAAATVTALTFDGLENSESLAIGTDYEVAAAFDDAGVGAGKTVTATAVLKNTTTANNYNLTNGTGYAGLTGNLTFLVVYDYQYDDLQDSELLENSGLLDEPPVPVRAGYDFGDWYKEEGCTNKWDFAADVANVGTVLYAQWRVITYTITYHLNGGVNHVGNPTTYTVEDAVPLQDPEKTGYVFAGWYTGDGTATTAIPTGSTGNREYDAKWFPRTRITLTAGNGSPAVDASNTRVLLYRIGDGNVEAYEADKEGTGVYLASTPAGKYIVLAENVPGHLTTYYADTHGITAWHEADTLVREETPTDMEITLHMAAIPVVPTGDVTIEGYVIYNGDNSTLKAKVARNATVGIYYSKKGAAADVNNPDDWTLVRTVQPDEDAYYIVRNLPEGTYMVVADIPGYEVAESYTVNATEGETYSDNNFFVDDETKTIVVADEKPTWTPTLERETFRLYPNPFNGTLHITGAEGCTLRVFTVTGAAVHTRKVTGADETIHLEHLPAGLYLFQLEKDGKTKTMKAVKNE